MKKLSLKRFQKASNQPPSRITNETVAEHRERILAGGRRFKYPMQYARHRLVINTIVVSIVAVILLIAIGWWQLYPAQNTSTFFYRITRVIPLPVASIDDEPVRYSDYLMNYNSSVHYLEQKEQANLKDANGKRQLEFYKSRSLALALGDAYAIKLAREQSISVSQDEVTKYIDNQRKARDGTVSKETYDAVILDYYGWSPSEYRHVMENKLIRQKVSYEVDAAAKAKMEKVATSIGAGEVDLEKIASQVGGDGPAKVTTGVSGLVPNNNQDGGLSEAALKMSVNQVSGVIKSTTGDGYYFVKLVEKTDSQLNYAYIQIPLTAFEQKLAKLKADNKIKKYINLEDSEAQGLGL